MAIYNLADSNTRNGLMRDDVQLLYREQRFTSCALLIMCFIDALASPNKDSSRGDFCTFVNQKFLALVADIDAMKLSTKPGTEVFYDAYRNGLTHRIAPKSQFGLARDGDCGGKYAAVVSEGSNSFPCINIDRLVSDFLRLL